MTEGDTSLEINSKDGCTGKRGTLNLDRCTKQAAKGTKNPWQLHCIFLPSLTKLFQRKSSVLPSPLSHTFHNTEDWQPKNLLIPRSAVGLACSGAASPGECLSNQFLKPPGRNGTGTAHFAWGQGREEDKTESTENFFFSQILENF